MPGGYSFVLPIDIHPHERSVIHMDITTALATITAILAIVWLGMVLAMIEPNHR